MIEQLWYGWAARGVEGLNMQQIIAASPGLTDRSALLTQVALTQCTPTSEPTFGWYAHNDIHVVFRRSPAGLDGRGRPGNYFVHVLAADRRELPASVLAAIVTSGRLLGGLPQEPSDPLPHVTLDDLPAVGESDPALLGALAGYLANLRAGRLTALATAPDQAAVLAGLIAATMPPQLGLPGFSAMERQEQAAHYDLVSGSPPSSLFGQVDPAGKVDPLAADSARLLVSAGHDGPAAECVELLAADQSSRRTFALSVAGWCAIERADPGSITPKTLQLLLDRPEIRRRFTGLPVLPRIVELAFSGDRLAGEVAAAYHLDGQPRVLDLVCDHVRAAPEGAATLHALVRAGTTDLAAAAMSTLVLGGQQLDLTSLGTSQQLALLNLFPLEPEVSPVVDILLRDNGLGTAVVGRPHYPLTWQVRAARRHVARVTPAQFTALLQQEPAIASALLAEHPDEMVIRRVGEALERIDVDAARQIVQAAGGLVDHRTEQTWWDAMYNRLAPSDQFAVIAERASRRHDIDDGAAVGAFSRAASSAMAQQQPSPSFIELWQIFKTIPATERAWRSATHAYVQLGWNHFSSQDVRRVFDAIDEVSDTSGRQVLLDLLVRRILAADDPGTFDRGMTEVEQRRGSPAAAELLLRSAISLPDLTATSVKRLLNWGVRKISCTHPPESIADALSSEVVRWLVMRTGYDVPEGLRAGCDNKLARRWLDQVTTDRREGWPSWRRWLPAPRRASS